ncbi:T9SS type A sorting domain-containing protein [Algibacter sp.]|uniref:T9SS type A sorting domain-containing protein n=1 Tax=Algibacter sp. TaxID=1872428 RepID=UPI003C721C47
MKYIATCLLLLCFSNLSFSQNDIEKNPPKESTVFKFHPNPAQDDLFILGTNKIKSIELSDVFGNRIALYQFNKSIIKLDISEFKSGIYLIQVTDENNRHEIKKVFIK